ncbi:hypothetical protein EKTHUN627_31580 [Enterobacter kobei]|nr:hypothetical protein EKTHUN627_31580 [Enterobacter kobei]
MVRKSFDKDEFTRVNHYSRRFYYPTGTPGIAAGSKETEMAFGSCTQTLKLSPLT